LNPVALLRLAILGLSEKIPLQIQLILGQPMNEEKLEIQQSLDRILPKRFSLIPRSGITRSFRRIARK